MSNHERYIIVDLQTPGGVTLPDGRTAAMLSSSTDLVSARHKARLLSSTNQGHRTGVVDWETMELVDEPTA